MPWKVPAIKGTLTIPASGHIQLAVWGGTTTVVGAIGRSDAFKRSSASIEYACLPPLGSRFTLSSGSRSVTFISSKPLTGNVSTIAADTTGCNKAISLSGAAVKLVSTGAEIGAGTTAGAEVGVAADHADAKGSGADSAAGVGKGAGGSFGTGAESGGKLDAGVAAMAGVGNGISIEFAAGSSAGADNVFGAGIVVEICDEVGTGADEPAVLDLVVATGSIDETGGGDGVGWGAINCGDTENGNKLDADVAAAAGADTDAEVGVGAEVIAGAGAGIDFATDPKSFAGNGDGEGIGGCDIEFVGSVVAVADALIGAGAGTEGCIRFGVGPGVGRGAGVGAGSGVEIEFVIVSGVGACV